MATQDFITTTLNLDINKIKTLDTVMIDGVMHIRISLKPEYPECPKCGGKVKIKGYGIHTYNHLPTCGIPTVIDWKRTRYICTDCGKTFSEVSPFGPENFHQSYALLNEVAMDLHRINFTFHDIAERHNLSTTIVELYADSFINAPRIRLPENLGIDEIRSDMAKYGGSYLCVFADNQHRTLNEVLPNRSKTTLSKYFEKIPKEEREEVLFVTIDMWEPYKDVCLKYLPNCKIAVDPFHVVKHLCDAFSDLRISIMNQCPKDSNNYYLLKKWHKLLESDSYDLDNKPQYNSKFGMKLNYRDLYEMLLKISPDLLTAYNLKEMYREFNKTCTYAQAPAYLDFLIKEFEKADLECYKEFVGLMKHWRTEIINSFERPYNDRRQSNALAESLNDKLRTLITVSNGYSNFERFRARAIYCLNDKFFYAITSSLKSKKRKGKKRGNRKEKTDTVTDNDVSEN